MVNVLLAEDNPGDVLLIREALKGMGSDFELTVKHDGELMLSHIDLIDKGEKNCPDIVLLDLNLPKASGHSLLARMRKSETCKRVPVIVVTSSDSARIGKWPSAWALAGTFGRPAITTSSCYLGAVVRRHVFSGIGN